METLCSFLSFFFRKFLRHPYATISERDILLNHLIANIEGPNKMLSQYYGCVHHITPSSIQGNRVVSMVKTSVTLLRDVYINTGGGT